MRPLEFDSDAVICLATGSGLTDTAVSVAQQSDLPCIAVNDAYRKAPWADVQIAFDRKWWIRHFDHGAGNISRKFTVEDTECLPVERLNHTGCEGFDPDWPNIRTGYNTGYGAVHLAIQSGAKKVCLVGYNMSGKHFFGDHPKELYRASPYKKFIDAFRGIIPAVNARGVEIINCTPGSALPWFPMMPLERALSV